MFLEGSTLEINLHEDSDEDLTEPTAETEEPTTEPDTAEDLTESRKSMEELLEKVNSLKKSLTECQNWIQKATESIKETYQKGSKTKRDYEAAKAVVETEKQERKPVIDRAQREVERLEKFVTPELLKRYKLIKKKYANPVAAIENNRCSGCGMSVSMSVVKKYQAEGSVMECENCGTESRVLTLRPLRVIPHYTTEQLSVIGRRIVANL